MKLKSILVWVHHRQRAYIFEISHPPDRFTVATDYFLFPIVSLKVGHFGEVRTEQIGEIGTSVHHESIYEGGHQVYKDLSRLYPEDGLQEFVICEAPAPRIDKYKGKCFWSCRELNNVADMTSEVPILCVNYDLCAARHSCEVFQLSEDASILFDEKCLESRTLSSSP